MPARAQRRLSPESPGNWGPSTVAVITKPFEFEGKRRRTLAEGDLRALGMIERVEGIMQSSLKTGPVVCPDKE